MQFYIEPYFLNIGPLYLHYYGLVYALTLIYMYIVLKKMYDEDTAGGLILYGGLGMIIGGRIVHFLFSNPSIFITQPLELLFIWKGGMAFFGGIAGALAGIFLYIRNKHNITFYDIAQKLAIPTAVGLFFGRIANFINQELVGTATDVSWCFNFAISQNPVIFDTVCRHPYQLYAAASHLILIGILAFVVYKKWNVIPHFLIWYSLLRFITDFFREESTRYIFGLSSWQILSLIIFISTIIWVIKNAIHNKSKHKGKKSSHKN